MARNRVRVCTRPGCPNYTTTGSHCRTHTPTTNQRGYNTTHQQTRRALTPHVEAGNAHCWRCHQPIRPGTPWVVGHDDYDRTITRGPEHRDCNARAAAQNRDA